MTHFVEWKVLVHFLGSVTVKGAYFKKNSSINVEEIVFFYYVPSGPFGLVVWHSLTHLVLKLEPRDTWKPVGSSGITSIPVSYIHTNVCIFQNVDNGTTLSRGGDHFFDYHPTPNASRSTSLSLFLSL